MTAETGRLELIALNPNAKGHQEYAADPAEAALLTKFCRQFFRHDQDPGQARNPAEDQTAGMNIAGWTAWDQFPFWTDGYRKSQPADPKPELTQGECQEWRRDTLLDYAMFLINSGGCRPVKPHPSTGKG